MVSMDAFASAFGFDAKSDDVWTTLGKVTAVGSGTLSVLLGGSATPTECEAYCVAGVGDIVFVAITKGRARAIAKRGNILSIPDSAVADASQTPSANQYGSALHVTDQQGVQVGYLGLIHETDDDLWTQLGATRDVNGSPAYNSLWIGLKEDGTPTVYVGGAQQAWRDALGLGSMATESASDYVSTSVGIGTVYEANKGSINTTANQDAYVQGAKITLPAGKYVIYTQWVFSSTSSAACSTTVGIGYSSGVWTDSRDRIRQADAWFTSHSTTYICTLAAENDIYSYGSSSIARSGCSSFIRAIKVA